MGSPFEQFEGRRFIHPVDEHQHAFCPLDVYSGLGDNGHGGGHPVLVFSFRRGDVNVVALGTYDRAVGLAQKIPDHNDMMDSADVERLWSATADHVEFRELPVPERFYPPGGNREESWRSLFYANLVSSFISEIRGDASGNEGNFDDGAWVQETINAVEASYRERRWVALPLA